MILRLYRLSRLALLWVFALAVALAPWLGGSHAEARPVEAMSLYGSLQGGTLVAPEAMMAHSGGMGHDCASSAESGVVMPDAPVTASDHGQGNNPSHNNQMTGCEDMCRMACHVVVILPATASMPCSLAHAHEVRPVATLETVERDVLVPPPRHLA